MWIEHEGDTSWYANDEYNSDEEYWDAVIAEWEETAHQEYLDEYGDDELE